MARKIFKSAQKNEPHEFEVGDLGVFRARGKVPASVIMRFAEETMADGEENASTAKMMAAMRELMSAAIMPEDRDRFFGALEDLDNPIEFNELLDVASWLAGEYTARPTGPDSAKPSSQTEPGSGSTPGASPTVLTFSRPDPTPPQPVVSSL